MENVRQRPEGEGELNLVGPVPALLSGLRAYWEEVGRLGNSSEGSFGPTEFKGILAGSPRVTISTKCLCGAPGDFEGHKEIEEKGWRKLNKYLICPGCFKEITK